MHNFVPVFLRAESTSFWEKIATWYQNSTLGELISYFHQTYFSIQFGAYDNFSIPQQTANTINKIIPALILSLQGYFYFIYLTLRQQLLKGTLLFCILHFQQVLFLQLSCFRE